MLIMYALFITGNSLYCRSTTEFHGFVDGIKADGGAGDGGEDVMGGLKTVFTQLHWRTGVTKVCFSLTLDLTCCNSSILGHGNYIV